MEDNDFQLETENVEIQDTPEPEIGRKRPLLAARSLEIEKNVFLIATCALLCVGAVPVLILSLMKSPSSLQAVNIFGISYYNFLFIFLISAAGLFVSSLFFFRLYLPVFLVIFIACLFCCIPMIIGLKQDLSLQQSMVNIPFFSNWPFFLRPLYIFVEVLLPAGILTFLFLQLRNLFSKKGTDYGFLAAAVYLGVAAYIGFSGLLQTGQPNIIKSFLDRRAATMATRGSQSTSLNRPAGNYPGRSENQRSNIASQADTQGPAADKSKTSIPVNALPVENLQIVILGRKVKSLEDMMDRTVTELEKIRVSLVEGGRPAAAPSQLMPPEESLKAQRADASTYAAINQRLGALSDKVALMHDSLDKSKSTAAENQPPAIADVGRKVELLAGKVDQLLSRFSQAGYYKAQQQRAIDNRSVSQSPITKQQNTASGELFELLQKIELLSDKVNRISDTLPQDDVYSTGGGQKQNKQ